MAQGPVGPASSWIDALNGQQAPLMLKNVNMALVSGALTPMELVAIAG